MPSGPFVSPWDQAFARPPLRRETRSFDLPDGRKLTLTFRDLDEIGKLDVTGRLQEYTARHLEGENGKPPQPLYVGKERIRATAKLFEVVSTLQCLEVPEEGEQWPAGQQPYGLAEWCGLALRLPRTWNEVLTWANSFMAADEGNPSGGQDEKTTSTTT